MKTRRIASRYLVGGVNSPVRAFRRVGGEPVMVVRGRGAEVVDARGARFVDFIMGWGALILGHNPPVVVRALDAAMRRGILFGLTSPAEVELARLITEAVPSVEQVRFTASGTEACMTAVRLARAHTRRSKIVTFEGCYHGHSDSLMAGTTAGIPAAFADDVVVLPYNDLGALERVLTREAEAIAGVIVEPVAANMGVVPPAPGFLDGMRRLTAASGAVLIFDEVVTGFRLSRGGAQALFRVKPDLTVFGKIIGGGLPIGAVGGARRIMGRLAPEGDVYHAGTFAGHPLSMAAGIATLRQLAQHPPYARLEQRAQRLSQALHEAAQRAGLAICVNRVGSMLTVFFGSSPMRAWSQVAASRQEQFAQWATALRRQGILVPPSPYEAMFVSTAHTEVHLDRMLRASRAAWTARSRRPVSHVTN